MENFFINENFHCDLESLINDLDIYEVEELGDDWEIQAEESNIEKIFTLNEDFVVSTIVEHTDKWEDRFPEESDDLFKRIKNAIKQSIDIEKMNSLLPELYYPNGKRFKITKKDLLAFIE